MAKPKNQNVEPLKTELRQFNVNIVMQTFAYGCLAAAGKNGCNPIRHKLIEKEKRDGE